jgi:adenylate kinase
MFVLILGAPGSGKGTQGKLLAERLGIPKIATGDILRAAVQKGSTLGKQAKRFMDGGQLVPDHLILDLIRGELATSAAREGAVLDGFPRTAAQAELVDAVLAERGARLNCIVLLDVDEHELVRRIVARGRLEGRSDDTEAAVRTRLGVYQRDTAPLVAHYAPRGNVHRVPGMGTVEQIAEEIKRVVGR